MSSTVTAQLTSDSTHQTNENSSHQSISSPPTEFNPAYIHWEFLPFSSLSIYSLYSLLKLRQNVFIVEQNCPFADCDGYDQMSMHLCCWYKNPQQNTDNNTGDSKGELIAYLRYVPANTKYIEPSIGRVVNSYQYRGLGIGRLLLAKSIEYLKLIPEYIKNKKIPSIRIGAQSRLKKFYMEFGFIFNGIEYLEDNQPHIEMIREEELLLL